MKNKTLIIIFAALLIMASCAYFIFRSGNGNSAEAVITLKGEVIHRIDLSSVEKSYTLDVNGSTVLVEKGRICIENADCPDRLCVKTGYTSGPSKPIVCLPKQIVINVTSAAEHVDVVVR